MPFPPTGRHSYLKRTYNISLEEYNTLLEDANFSCMICKLHENEHNSALHVDHDHKSLGVRGILCTNCNTGLGHVKDDVNLVKAMINYINLWQNTEWEWINEEKFFFKRSFWNPEDFKKCSSCKQWRKVDLWFKTTNRSDRNYRQYRPYCKACNSSEMKRRDGKRRPKNLKEGETHLTIKRDYSDYESLRARKDSYYYTNFGITYEDYLKIFSIQNGKCFICHTQSDSKTLAVDHCHTTAKVRGLLCMSCNIALGMFKENVEIMEKIIEYLKEDRK